MHLATVFTVLDGSSDKPPPQTVLSMTGSDIDGDGVADVLSTSTLFRDGRGNLVSSIEDLDFNAAGAVPGGGRKSTERQ